MSCPHSIVFLITDQFQAIDLFGPMDAFAEAENLSPGSYTWSTCALDNSPIRTEAGTQISADFLLEDCPSIDTLIVVGGVGVRKHTLSSDQNTAITNAITSSHRIGSVCSGAFLLAQLSLCTGKKLTTHWRYANELRRQWPAIEVNDEALFIQDGRIWSSAGVTAGLDMAMAMIQQDLGTVIADAVARQLVVYLRRSGHQSQFSEPLSAQSQHTSRLANVLSWIAENPKEKLDLETLATKSGMSVRHFSRTFLENTGYSPARYVERIRLDHARILLTQGDGRISVIASSSGFKSGDSFRRAFEKQFGISPSEYRRQFKL